MSIFRNLTTRQRLLWGILLVSVIAISIDTLLTYSELREDFLEGIDGKLKTGAYGASHILPPEFHARIEDQNSISEKERLKNVTLLTQFALQTGLDDVYSCMMFGDSIRFTSGIEDPFFGSYDTPPDSLRKSLVDGKIRYAQYTDGYGTFRSVFVPLKTANGKIYVVGADIPITLLNERLWKIVQTSMLDEVLIFIVLFVGAYAVISWTMKPLSELTGYTKVLVEQDLNWGECIRTKIKSICETKRDEVGKLADALMQMESMLQTYIVNLTETTAAKERIESELSIARNIQMGFLPQTFPAFPDHKEFDLHAIIEPAKEVGGDLYDYFMIDDRHLFFLIGDVSDKGVPAALFMAVTKTLFGTHASQADRAISEVTRRVNKDLSSENPWQMFVTAFACVLDIETGMIHYCDGGHEPPFIIRLGNEVEIVKKVPGAALCFFEDFSYVPGTMQLSPGDALVLYTDGVTEAMNKDRKMFRREGITEALRGYSSIATPAATISQTLLDRVRDFADNEPQSDDITILVVRYYGTDVGKA